MNPLQLQAIRSNIQMAKRKNMRPAFAYDRISDEVQSDGVSLDFQAKHGAQYAQQQRLALVHAFQMVESAHKEGRRVFNEMLDLALELKVQDLIFKNVDRMSRNYNDLVRIDQLIDREGFYIHFYQSNLVVHRHSSYNDRFIIGIQLAVSKHTSDKISQDVREANRFKAERGTAPYQPPFGYRYNRITKQHEIDPAVEESARFLFDRFDQGDLSMQRIADILNEKGIRTSKGHIWHKSSVHHVLANPFYHGEFRYHGRVWPGNHPPYYPKQRHKERLQRINDRFHGERKRDFTFLYSSFFTCECGLSLTGDFKKGRYVYYRHKCPEKPKQVYLREPDVVAMMDGAMQNVSISPKLGNFLRKILRAYCKTRIEIREDRLGAAKRKATLLRGRKQRLLELYSSERIPRADLEAKIDQVETELHLAEAAAEGAGPSEAEVLERCEQIVHAFERLPREYASSDQERRTRIWRWVAHGAVLVPAGNRIKQVRWKKPFESFFHYGVADAARRMLTNVPVRESYQHAPVVGRFSNESSQGCMYACSARTIFVAITGRVGVYRSWKKAATVFG